MFGLELQINKNYINNFGWLKINECQFCNNNGREI